MPIYTNDQVQKAIETLRRFILGDGDSKVFFIKRGTSNSGLHAYWSVHIVFPSYGRNELTTCNVTYSVLAATGLVRRPRISNDEIRFETGRQAEREIAGKIAAALNVPAISYETLY